VREEPVTNSDPTAASFGDFVAGALPGLLRFGHVLTGDPKEAEELVQEALARALRRWRSVRADDAMGYVRKIMINTHISRWRGWAARVRLGDVPEGISGDMTKRAEDWDLLRRGLAKLPARQRTVLVLRYYEDLPDTSIAALMGCSMSTVKTQAARGLSKLRPILETQTVSGGET
jgi:RNA polymerase sigma-70 factor (sigma-E family)